MTRIFILILVLASFVPLNSQVKFEAIGGYIGLGSIKGNSASVGSFTTSAFFDTKLSLAEDFIFRFSFHFARKLESLLPDNSQSRYFPFVRGGSIKLIFEQPLSEYFFLEEGLGILALNDRTFSDVDKWAFGAAFNLGVGLDFRNYKQSGFKLLLGSDIGTTFNATTPSYISFHIQTGYYF